jgi:hypothetical protein
MKLIQGNNNGYPLRRITYLYLWGYQRWIILICLFLASLLSTAVAAIPGNDQPYILSTRVGPEIDGRERDYFCLFPKVSGFLKAETFMHSDDHLELRISRKMNGSVTDTTFRIDTELKAEFQSYIDDFEMIIREEKKISLRLIRGNFINRSCLGTKIAEQKGKKKDESGSKIMVITSDGQLHTGRILSATDTSLLLWQSPDSYDWRKVHIYGRVISVSGIEQITEPRKGGFGSGLKYGAIVGGGLCLLIFAAPSDDPYAGIGKLVGAGVVLPSSLLIGGIIGVAKGRDHTLVINGRSEYYNPFLPKLKKGAIFPTLAPPELQNLMNQLSNSISFPIKEQPSSITSPQIKPSFLTPNVPMQKEKVGSSPSGAKLHLSFTGALMRIKAHNNMLDAFNESGFSGYTPGYWDWFGYVEPSYYPEDHSVHPICWNLLAEYNLSNRYLLGLALSSLPRQEINGIGGEWERITSNAYSMIVEYIPKPAAPLFMSNFEFAAGAGICYQRFTIEGTLWDESTSFEDKENQIGLQVRTSLDYYLVKNVSFRLLLNGRLLPAITVPEISRTFSVESYDWERGEFVTTQETKILQTHKVNFSSVDLSLGLRLHL